MNKPHLLLAIFFLLFLPLTSLLAQRGIVPVQGIVSYENGRLKGVEVKLFNKNELIETHQTPIDGRFRFKLEVNNYYGLEFHKEGYIPKRFIFNTKTPDTTKQYHAFKIEVAMIPNKVDYTSDSMDLDFPITIVNYDEEEEDFAYEKEYTYQMLDEQDSVVRKFLKKKDLERERKVRDTLTE